MQKINSTNNTEGLQEMEYVVIIQASVLVEANSRDEAICNAESELVMTDCEIDRVLDAYPIDED